MNTHHPARLLRIAAGIAALGVLSAATALAQTTDSAQVARIVESYHSGEASGDSTAMLALLSDDAVIMEAGGIETKAEFRAHHIAADIAFLRGMRVERGSLRVRVRGTAAWVTSTSTMQGESNGRAVNSAGAELMVLTKESTGWKITAIHWSSRQRRPS
jgi:ketosteroid isomerase-like protein